MGGSGSGRQKSKKCQIEECSRTLNIRHLILQKILQPEKMTSGTFCIGLGLDTLTLEYQCVAADPLDAWIRLRYRPWAIDDYVDYSINFEATPLYFGNFRWYFVCPQCQRRCCALFLPEEKRDFACWQCSNLIYRSSQQSHTRFEKLDRWFEERFGAQALLVSVNSFLDTLGSKIMRPQPRHTVAHVSPGQVLYIHAVQLARLHCIDAETRAAPGGVLPRYQRL